MNILELKKVTAYYSQNIPPVVNNISFVLKEGQITTIIGPNGSGKTTIIRAILGLIPYTGRINVFGRSIEKNFYKVGYVPQRFKFDADLPVTAFEVIKMPCEIMRLENKNERINEVANLFGILNILHKRIGSISGGQLQRVLLVRSMVHSPKLLILDEPEAGIDVGGEQTLYHLLERLVKEKKISVLIASHELDVVFRFSTHVICVNRDLICDGKPEEVINDETLFRLYGVKISLYRHKH